MKNIKLTSAGWTWLALSLGFTIVNAVLRLTGVVSWSWWIITAPVWGSFVLAILFILLCWAMVKIWSEPLKDETHEEIG